MILLAFFTLTLLAVSLAARPSSGRDLVTVQGRNVYQWHQQAVRRRVERDHARSRAGEATRSLRTLRKAAAHRPDSLEAIRLASVAYNIPERRAARPRRLRNRRDDERDREEPEIHRQRVVSVPHEHVRVHPIRVGVDLVAVRERARGRMDDRARETRRMGVLSPDAQLALWNPPLRINLPNPGFPRWLAHWRQTGTHRVLVARDGSHAIAIPHES